MAHGLAGPLLYAYYLRPPAVDVLNPESDVATNSWTNDAGSGTNIYQAIDEDAASDADYVQSAVGATSGSYYETAVQDGTDPSLATGHVVHYRYQEAGGGFGATNVTVSLRQGGGTEIATWTHTDIATSWVTADQTLSAGEANAISDYTDLRLRFAPTAIADATPAIVPNSTGTVSNLTSQASTGLTVTSGMASAIQVGHYVIAWVGVDNSGASGARPGLTITDPRSNVWTVTTGALNDPGAASAGAACYIAYARVTTIYQTSDSITFNWGTGSPAGKSISMSAFSGIHPTVPVAVAEVAASASNTAFTISITPSAAKQLVVTAGAIEGASGDTWTNDADTTNGSWSALTEVSTGNTGVGDMTLQGAYKAVTASGAQTWNSTITTRDWAANAIVFANDPGTRVQVSWANVEIPLATGPPTVTGQADATLAFDAPAVGTRTVFGTADATLVFAAPATGTRVVGGTADATLAFAAPAVGARLLTGTADATITFTAPATGTRQVAGAALATLTFASTADGSVTVPGQADANLTFAAPAVGSVTHNGTADATITFSAPATGTRTIQGTADATFTFTSTGDGTVTAEVVNGTADTTITFAAPATGSVTVPGTADAALTFASTADGTKTVSGTATADLAFTAPATGSRLLVGTADATITFASTADGMVVQPGAGMGDANFVFAAPAVGTRTVFGQATTDLAFAAPASGTVVHPGQGVTDLTFAAPATGSVEHPGTALASFTFTATGDGTRTTQGTADATLAFSAPATGTRVVSGQAVTNLTFTSTGDGTILTPGAGVADANFVFAAPALGSVGHSGQADANLAFAVPAVGTKTVSGTALAALTFASTADGTTFAEGSGVASVDLTFAAPATGTRVVTGTADATVAFSAPASGSLTHPGQATTDVDFDAPATGSVTVSGTATATFVFAEPATGTRETSGSASTTFTFTAPAQGRSRGPQFFDYGAFLEYVRSQVEDATGRSTYLSQVTQGERPTEPFCVVHAFGPTGALERAFDGQASALSFYLQVDGVGRHYGDALWMLDKAVAAIRALPPPSYVNDLLVMARSSAFEINSEALRAVGQRVGVRLTRP